MFNNKSASYADLGNRLKCGPDLVKERAREKRKPWLSNKVPNNPNGNVPRDIEQALYRPFTDKLSFTHGMKLADGTPWGGSETFVVELSVSPHAQTRMDMRCVTYSEVTSLISSKFAELEAAWLAGNASAYKDVAVHFLKGSPSDEKGLRGGGIKVPVASEGVRVHEEPLGSTAVPAPTGNKVTLVVKTVMADGRFKKTQLEVDQEECVVLLSDLGYNVIRKKAYRVASSSVLTMEIEGGQWLGGFRPSDMKQTMKAKIDISSQQEKLKYLEANLYEMRKAFSEWVRDNLIEPASKDDFRTYSAHYKSLTEGSVAFEARDGITYTIQRDTSEQPRLESALLVGPTFSDVYDVKVPDRSVGDKMEFCFVISEVKGDSAKEKILADRQRDLKVQDCIKKLEGDYNVYSPEGARLV